MSARRSGGEIRIIAGQWRSRRLAFPQTPGLRPTPDRVRETLFNWLRPVIDGAYCLDLFAGSGALGFEALSRGAGRCVMVDERRDVAEQLRRSAAILGAERAEIVCCGCMEYLNRKPEVFDIVFLDPPFGSSLLDSCAALLEQRGWLASAARIYIETDHAREPPQLPENWRITHEQRAGQVGYSLAMRYA